MNWIANLALVHALRSNVGWVRPATGYRRAVLRSCTGDSEAVPQSYFVGVDYDKGNVPWDLSGRPQPPVRDAALQETFGEVGTTILDCGCGAGDNANFLATCGYDVLGLDFPCSTRPTRPARPARQ